MKLVHCIVAILLLTAVASAVGYFIDPEQEAAERTFGFGVITFVLSCIAAFIATSRNRLWAMAATAALLSAVAAASAIAYFAGAEKEAGARAAAIGFLTLVVGGGVSYLVYYMRGMKSLDIPAPELEDEEVVWAKTTGSMVHYKSGNPLKIWEAVGGRLFLTSKVLEFRSFPAELYVYRLIIPLENIRRARPCRILGLISGALRVERLDGSYELFTFGAAFNVSREWADAIMDFRDDLEDAEGD